ncbi:hypothetical protein Cni_G09909 [Canna indica]|uniref:Uncharacterized protein n=1 Tax=Canna indica TaxID=4628 RepID=A0AAQ3K3C8_9LILI|nr:hypothetical protein Cni_G09909 [Canna indica]
MCTTWSSIYSPSPYHMILGRPPLNNLGVAVSTPHLALKFPISEIDVGVVHANQKELCLCYNECLKQKSAKPRQALRNPSQQSSSGLDSSKWLKNNVDPFAWTPIDMLEIDPKLICHELAINPRVKSVAQREREIGAERRQASLEETKKPLKAEFIREIRFTTLLTNAVMLTDTLVEVQTVEQASNCRNPYLTNGLVETANKVILIGLRKKLDHVKGHWPQELLEVLWGYNTTAQSSTQETLYRLIFGAKAMIRAEIAEPSHRRTIFDEQNNSKAREAELDLVEEEQKLARVREEATSLNYKWSVHSFLHCGLPTGFFTLKILTRHNHA